MLKDAFKTYYFSVFTLFMYENLQFIIFLYPHIYLFIHSVIH